MASYNARQRDPLLDQNTQAMLERRGRELMGLVLLAAALAFVALLGSYSPDDPGWMVATDEPARNLLGRFGAAVASTLVIIGGKGAWGIPVVLLAWGLRFVLHRGADRALSRMIFAVIAVALGSVFAATHVPGADWPHPAIGLGGLFGDTVLGAVLTLLPVGTGTGLKMLSLAFGAGTVGMYLFVTGFDLAEVRALGRFLLRGTVTLYALGLDAAGRSAAGTARAAAAMHERREAARAATPPRGGEPPAFDRPASLKPAPLRAEPRAGAPAPERPGLLAQALRRFTAPAVAVAAAPLAAAPGEDRIRARIGEAIRSRVQAGAPVAPIPPVVRREPPVV
ncbi:MAG TPA: DNA translocase FtsK 4TM domain-containing protein, partial [Paracoccaceae bacterium]|nr:DNA translocase FtsK 4TM domain-containing protein [Paracoccaceae bacterium]